MSAFVRRALGDAAPLVLLVTAATVGLEMLILRAIKELPVEAVSLWLDRPLFSRLVQMLLGAELTSGLTPTSLATIGLAHPLLYTLSWVLVLTLCTRYTTSDIETGCADLLLTLPVTRAGVYGGATVVWVLAGIPVSVAAVLGIRLAEGLLPLWEPIEHGRLALVGVNFYALYVAIGGAASLVGSLVTRRGHAIGIVLAGLLGSFLLNFVATIWPAAERVAAIGVLHYYKPLPIVRSGELPIHNIAILVLGGVLAWILGLWRFGRRDVAAS